MPSFQAPSKHHKVEVWASLGLSEVDSNRIHDFFVSTIGLKAKAVVPKMHLTIYHARRPLPGLENVLEEANLILPSIETRFMVMAPGGENPRPDLDPAKLKVGIRIHRRSGAMETITKLRLRMLAYESSEILGSRRPSTLRVNAFGPRNFQPHMTLLRPRSGIERDLTTIGRSFREEIGSLQFNSFEIQVVKSKFAQDTSGF